MTGKLTATRVMGSTARQRLAPTANSATTRDTGTNPGALILGGDCGALGVARSLGRAGIPVGLLRGVNPLAAFSRYTSWSSVWPGAESPGAVDWLLDLAKSRGLSGWVLFPAGDAEVRLVSRNHRELSRHFRLTTPPWQQTKWAADKNLTYRRAAELGIPHPRTYAISTPDEAEAAECLFPLIIKPAGKQGINALTRAKAWQVHDRAALVALFRSGLDLAGEAGLIVQELIPGADANRFSYCAVCRDGVPLVTMSARRTRQTPSGFGTGTFVESIDEHGFDAAAERFLAAINFTGMVEIEFKLDPRDSHFKLIDVNPRVWTWNALGALAGTDFTVAMWDIALGHDIARQQARAGASWLYTTRDLPESLKLMRAGKLAPRHLLDSFRNATGYAVLAWDDPLPALADLPYGLLRRLRLQ